MSKIIIVYLIGVLVGLIAPKFATWFVSLFKRKNKDVDTITMKIDVDSSDAIGKIKEIDDLLDRVSKKLNILNKKS